MCAGTVQMREESESKRDMI